MAPIHNPRTLLQATPEEIPTLVLKVDSTLVDDHNDSEAIHGLKLDGNSADDRKKYQHQRKIGKGAQGDGWVSHRRACRRDGVP